MALFSLFFGIFSIIFAIFVFPLGLILGLFGLFFGALSFKDSKEKELPTATSITGIITSAIGTTISLLVTLACLSCINFFSNPMTQQQFFFKKFQNKNFQMPDNKIDNKMKKFMEEQKQQPVKKHQI